MSIFLKPRSVVSMWFHERERERGRIWFEEWQKWWEQRNSGFYRQNAFCPKNSAKRRRISFCSLKSRKNAYLNVDKNSCRQFVKIFGRVRLIFRKSIFHKTDNQSEDLIKLSITTKFQLKVHFSDDHLLWTKQNWICSFLLYWIERKNF